MEASPLLCTCAGAGYVEILRETIAIVSAASFNIRTSLVCARLGDGLMRRLLGHYGMQLKHEPDVLAIIGM